MRCGRALVTVVLVASTVAPSASADDAGERARLDGERRRIEERHRADVLACQSRFAVNACLEEARAQRRAALDPLRRRELDLDDAERRRRAAERAREVELRRQETLVRPPPPVPAPERPLPVTAEPAVPAASAAPPPPPRNTAAAAARRAEAARERREAAAAEREKIRRREAERQARQKSAEPLPTPAPLAR